MTRHRILAAAFLAVPLLTRAQTPASTPDDKPLPEIHALLLDVERNQRLAEAKTVDYTYHVHVETTELDNKGHIKKNTVTDSDSVSVDGVRVNRVTARDGKPLTPDEAQKESEHVQKEIEKAKDRRAKLTAKGENSDSRGDPILPASRILELSTFTNPRRELIAGRPTIVFDYAGDPKAKKNNQFEGIVRDLVGTVWIDEQDHVLTRAQGHFLNDFKVGGGLVLDIHKGLSFDAQFAKVNGAVWLPTTIEGQGSARILLVDGVNGRFRLVTSDYRKFAVTTDTEPATEKKPPPPGP